MQLCLLHCQAVPSAASRLRHAATAASSAGFTGLALKYSSKSMDSTAAAVRVHRHATGQFGAWGVACSVPARLRVLHLICVQLCIKLLAGLRLLFGRFLALRLAACRRVGDSAVSVAAVQSNAMPAAFVGNRVLSSYAHLPRGADPPHFALSALHPTPSADAHPAPRPRRRHRPRRRRPRHHAVHASCCNTRDGLWSAGR